MTTRLENEDSSVLRQDMKAWAKWTETQLPDIDDTRRQLAAAVADIKPELRRRRRVQRRWIAAVAIALVALVLFVPLPVERSVGRDVTVTLSAPDLAESRVEQIARLLQGALASDTAKTAPGEPGTFSISARTTRSRQAVDELTGGFRELLERSGLSVDIQVAEAYEIVRQSVYAHITNQHLVLVSLSERSADHIEGGYDVQISLDAGAAPPSDQ